MTTTDTPIAEEAAESERRTWYQALSVFDRELLVAYLIGETEAFDRARAFVERIQAGASA